MMRRTPETNWMEFMSQPTDPTPAPSRQSAEELSTARLLQVARSLQSTLMLSDLVAAFSHELAQDVPHAGVQFVPVHTLKPGATGAGGTPPRSGFSLHLNGPLAQQEASPILIGEVQDHRISYQMEVFSEALGELVLFRGLPFSMRELEHIEHLIGVLMHPLKNALMYAQALRMAQTDPLTGVGNRTAFNAAIRREVASAARHGMPLSVLILDVDHFKTVNDTHGHLVGDKVLQAVAAALCAGAREIDQVFRFGGEEFVVVLGNTPCEGAEVVGERLRAAVSNTCVETGERAIGVSVSIGIGCLEPTSDLASSAVESQIEALLEAADQALYCAKNSGRNCVSALR